MADIQGRLVQPTDNPQPGQFWFEGLDRVKWLVFGCPKRPGRPCRVPVAPQRIPNGSSWHWNGSVVNPTLTPSINCRGCGWHGYVAVGQFTNA